MKMNVKSIKRQWVAIFGAFMVCMLLLQSNTAQAAISFPLLKTSFLSAENTTSKAEGKEQSEDYKILNATGTSLWFFDPSGYRQVIRTRNNPAVLHHTDGTVEVTVRQEGGGGTYQMINGELMYIPGETIEDVLTATKQYSVTTYKINYNTHIRDQAAPYSIFTVGANTNTPPGSSILGYRYETNVYIYWDRSDLPAAPNLSFSYDAATDKMILLGADSTMEYRAKTAVSSAWQPCNDGATYFDAVGAANTTYFVRYAANGTQEASQIKEIVLPGKRYAPAVTYNTTSETLSGLSTAMEMQIGDGSYTPLTVSTMNLSDIVDAIQANTSLPINVRHMATETMQASLHRSLTLFPRAATPTTLVFNPLTTTLTGYTSAMQYKTDTDTSWRAMSGTALSLVNFASAERDVAVYVRLKPTASNAASPPCEIAIPRLLAGPSGTLEFDKEIISGLTNAKYQYSLTGSSWTNLTVTNGTWNIASLISSTAKTLYLRAVPTETSPVTASTVFNLPARPATPTTPRFVYDDVANPGKALLTGLSSGMEYRPSTTSVWIAATGTDIPMSIPAASATYYVRYAPTDVGFGSANRALTLFKAGVAPSVAYNTTKELVTGLNAKTMEMKIGTGAYSAIGTGTTTYDMSTLVSAISPGSSLTVTVRTKASATAPASLERVLTIYPRLAAPSSAVFNHAPLTLTGYTTAMQYRLDTDAAGAWRAMSGTTLNLETFASAARDVSVHLRMKPTTSASASQAVVYVIPMLLTGPTGTIDYTNESITGLPDGSYQRSVNGATWTTMHVADGSCDISSLITTSARTIYLRKAATATTPITAYTTFSIPRRPMTPSSPTFFYNDANNPDKVVFKGLTTEMEYRKSTDTAWTAVTDPNLVYDPQATSTVYHVRNIATSDAWASSYKTLTLAAMPIAPSIAYTESTETLSKLSTAYEISFDGGAYSALSASTLKLSDRIDNIPVGGTLEVKVRRKATSVSPAGIDTKIVIAARGLQTASLDEILPDTEKNLDMASEISLETEVDPGE